MNFFLCFLRRYLETRSVPDGQTFAQMKAVYLSPVIKTRSIDN